MEGDQGGWGENLNVLQKCCVYVRALEMTVEAWVFILMVLPLLRACLEHLS